MAGQRKARPRGKVSFRLLRNEAEIEALDVAAERREIGLNFVTTT
jgi:hypothetical protein